MARVVALYRYPVKGLTPESCASLTVLESGRIAGDRALAFRFADSGLPEDAWSRKYGFSVLANTPGIARLSAQYSPHTRRLRISLDDQVLADHAVDGDGRKALAAAVEAFVMTLPENPLSNHPERRPLQLIGDGSTPRYHDSQAGEITLHSRESLAQVAAAVGTSALEESRFRSNIAIDGVPAWAEQDWLGRKLRIGTIELEVVRPKTRCLATHANPRTGERDHAVMQVLVRAFEQQQPTFAIALTTRGAGGEIRVGDPVTVFD
jgi:uncharacterized protein YcbX